MGDNLVMSQYCYVNNGVLSPPQDLPQNWGNISNFNLLPPQALATKGWYPFIPATPPAYNESTQKLVEGRTFDGSQVNQTWQVVSLDQQGQIAFATARLQAIGQAITPFLDSQVSSRQYDSILSATSWNLSNITVYKTEGQQATAYRDQIWQSFNNLVAGVQAGNTSLPTVDAWFAGLPRLWSSNGTLTNGNGNGNGNGNKPI